MESLLGDASHEVRAMAAWCLIRAGEVEKGIGCLEHLLTKCSYATLTVLNMLDWIGEGAQVLQPIVAKLRLQTYEARMQQNLLANWQAE